MFINKEQLETRRREENNLLTRMKPSNDSVPIGKTVELDTSKFRKDGTPASKATLTPEMRAVVAATAMMAGAKVAAEVGNVSESYASMLGRGEYAHQEEISPEERDRRNQELRDKIYSGLAEIRGVAQDKLLRVLGLINDENLEAIQPKDRARLAAQMANQLSGVIDRAIPKDANHNDNRSAHLHLYAPERRPLGDFAIKVVNQIPTGKDESNATASS